MGEAVARRFAGSGSAGDRLLLADVSAERLAPLAEELGAEHIRCDITSDSDVTAVAGKLDGIDAAVLTAGLSPTMASARTILDVNLTGTARVAEALLPAMRAGGVLVCFASTASYYYDASAFSAQLAEPRNPQLYEALVAAGADVQDTGLAYSISKFGVRQYVRRASAAWGKRGARIVSVSPGLIETPMGAQEFAQQPHMQTLLDMTPLARQGSADEVAAVACFLASPEASFVTGTDVLVDGGSVASVTG